MKVLFIAPVDKFSLKDSGYGTAAAGIALVLEKMKKEGKIDDVLYMNTSKLSKNDMPKERVDVSITVVHPNTFLHFSPGLDLLQKAIEMSDRKFLSIVWETDRLPASWTPIFERNIFDAFITPSYFVADLILDRTDRPVYYYPHYIHIPDIPTVDINDKLDENTFTLLYIGQDTMRKGMQDAIISYLRALHSAEDTRLVLKYHRLSDKEIDTQTMIYHTTITNSSKPKTRVYSITHMLDRKEMYALYHMSSCLLFPSRGEGFGLPVAEAMSAGIPVIYTNWSSIPEVAAAPGNIPLEYTLDEAVGMFHHGYDIGSKYSVPSISSCMAAITSKYTEWKQSKEDYYGAVKDNRGIIDRKFGYESVSACIEHFIHMKDGFAPKSVGEVMGYEEPSRRRKEIADGNNAGGHNILQGGQRFPEPVGPPSLLNEDPDQSGEDNRLVCTDLPDTEESGPESDNRSNQDEGETGSDERPGEIS